MLHAAVILLAFYLGRLYERGGLKYAPLRRLAEWHTWRWLQKPSACHFAAILFHLKITVRDFMARAQTAPPQTSPARTAPSPASAACAPTSAPAQTGANTAPPKSPYGASHTPRSTIYTP